MHKDSTAPFALSKPALHDRDSLDTVLLRFVVCIAQEPWTKEVIYKARIAEVCHYMQGLCLERVGNDALLISAQILKTSAHC